MSGRVQSAAGYLRTYLSANWEFSAASTDSIATIDALNSNDTRLAWQTTTVPTTAAASLRSLRAWSIDDPPRRFDADDWWYRCRFTASPAEDHSVTVLGFDGLATVAEVWLNGTLILTSENMFAAHEINVDAYLRGDNELAIRFLSLDKLLAARRPRPRWRAPMIENQQLRWFRTTLLGRTPGWSPPAAAVGPWRPIWLERRRHFRVERVTLATSVSGANGIVDLALDLTHIGNAEIVGAELIIERNGQHYRGNLERKQSHRFAAHLAVPGADLWWPHTHGEPALYTAKIAVKVSNGGAQSTLEIPLHSIGFRTITLNSDGDFQISVNGVPIFCRGACWTPIDPVTLAADGSQYADALQQVRNAGMNMLRISGTMTYESDEFLDLCDSNGILLWQDFMFANMDYPTDENFIATVTTEIQQQLRKLSGRACLAMLCGNSEVEQQAAMWGATREYWTPQLFHETLAQLSKLHAPTTPYWPSSAHGGALPYQGDSGTTSYYGVGAYLRPLEDARRSELKFATECLAFANIPDDSAIEKMPRGLALRVHHPEWKARAPRDLGAGWDFEDVRDHYLQVLCGMPPEQLRYSDHDRYLAISRMVSGQIMATTFGEWRRKDSKCNGALIWLLRDLWPGAGWGIIDSLGKPKAPYYYLRRTLQPLSIAVTDEGGNGLFIHVSNERRAEFTGTLVLAVYKSGAKPLVQVERPIAVSADAKLSLPAAALLDGFYDLSNAYRFGPPACDYVVATLRSSNQTTVAEHVFVRSLQESLQKIDLGLSASAVATTQGCYAVSLYARELALAITIEAAGYHCEDQYFDLVPDRQRVVIMRASGASAKILKATVTALNSHRSLLVDIRN